MGKKEMRMNRLVEIINSRGYIPLKKSRAVACIRDDRAAGPCRC